MEETRSLIDLILCRFDVHSLIEFLQSNPEYKNIAVQFDEKLEGIIKN